MQELALVAKRREGTGKGAAGRLRRNGMVPAILYGPNVEEAIPLTVSVDELERVRHKMPGLNVLLDLTVEGESAARKVIFKKIERHPVKDIPLHIDFYETESGRKMIIELPIHIVGKAEGVTLGGILDLGVRKLKVECLPKNIPAFIEVDVTSLNIGDSLHIKDIAPLEGVRFIDDPIKTIVAVAAPAGLESKESEEEEKEEEAAEDR